MHRKLHKHGRRSYLSVGTFGDSQSLLEREPLRSKDRGLFSYNIDNKLGHNIDNKLGHTRHNRQHTFK